MRNRSMMVLVVFVTIAWLAPMMVQGQSTKNINKVTVLIEGYAKAIEGHQFLPGASDDGARRVAGTVVLIRGNNAIIVSDPGMVTDRALIVEALKKEGVPPEDVTHVFISHHHPDHTVSIALFPNAEVVDFWARYKGDLWQDHGDGYEIAHGIKILRTPGHTEEDASLVVETTEGTYVLTHLWSFPDITSGEDSLAWSQEKLRENRKKILQIADWIIPGHGNMFKNPQKGQK